MRLALKYTLLLGLGNVTLLVLVMLMTHFSLHQEVSGLRERFDAAARADHQRLAETHARSAVALIRHRLFDPLFDKRVGELERIIRHDLAAWPGVRRVLIADAEGLLLTDGSLSNQDFLTPLALPAKPSTDQDFQLTPADYGFRLSFPVAVENTLAGHVVIELEDGELHQRLQRQRTLVEESFNELHATMHRTGLLSTLLIALIGALFSYRLSKTLSHPLRALMRSAERMTNGDLTHRIAGGPNNDLGDLTAAFNRMAESLQRNTLLLQNEIAERRRTEEQLRYSRDCAESANQAKSAFLAHMSHELRTPLTAILGFGQLMDGDPHLHPSLRKPLATIQRSGEHLLAVINDVLDAAKTEAGKTELHPEDFDLHQLLEGLSEMLGFRAGEKGLRFHLTWKDDLPRQVRADVRKLRQILLNLLGNAVKYTEQGGIYLRAETETPPQAHALRLYFEVEDTGIGITAEQLPHLFEPFYQTPECSLRRDGTGLGLTISRQYVQLMGGEIQVRSRPRQGSRFSFSIDAAAATRPPATPEIEPGVQVTGLAEGQPRYRLLITDDDALSRQLLVEMLRPLGFEVRECANGREAVQAARDWRPHLIWMDLQMPELDGRQATAAIRALPNPTPRPVIAALSACVFANKRDDLLHAGFDEWLHKPYCRNEIFAVLTRRLGVRYRYAAHRPAQNTTSPYPLSSAGLSRLPPAWRKAFADAIPDLDRERLLQMLDELKDAPIASALRQRVEIYAYDELLRLFEAAE